MKARVSKKPPRLTMGVSRSGGGCGGRMKTIGRGLRPQQAPRWPIRSSRWRPLEVGGQPSAVGLVLEGVGYLVAEFCLRPRWLTPAVVVISEISDSFVFAQVVARDQAARDPEKRVLAPLSADCWIHFCQIGDNPFLDRRARRRNGRSEGGRRRIVVNDSGATRRFFCQAAVWISPSRTVNADGADRPLWSRAACTMSWQRSSPHRGRHDALDLLDGLSVRLVPTYPPFQVGEGSSL